MSRGTVIRAVAIGGVILLAVVAVLVGTRRSSSAGAAGPQYNVLLITVDTTRADRLGCYGYSKNTTPNLDALAVDGVRFELAISTAAVTPIAHASILTGLNSKGHGVRVIYGPAGHFLEDSVPTLATILKEHGWDTGAFVSAYTASERFGLQWGFDVFESQQTESVVSMDPSKPVPRGVLSGDGFWLDKRVASAQRRADATTDQALAWLKLTEAPFLLWVHYFDPHDPSLVPPKEILARFGVDRTAPNPWLAAYDPDTFFMDLQIGRLLEWLKQTGQYDRTIIVVVADHGQGLGDHGWMQHRLLYQEQIRVPLIVRVPEGPRGRVVGALVSVIDVAPTILDVLDIEAPAPVDGRSLLPSIEGANQPPRLAYAEALNSIDEKANRALPPHQQDLLFCVMDRTWKLIHHRDHPENSELYNLVADPGELNNVITRYPQQAARLLQELTETGAMVITMIEPDAPLDEAARRKLESLGYLGGED